MSEETRAQIITTPNHALPKELLQEYSNSAHGVPSDLEDLRILLPRYLELMAANQDVDYVGVGTELLRFGQASAKNPALFSNKERAILEECGAAMVLHFAFLDTQEGASAIQTPFSLMETLICGGWSVAAVTSAMQSAFDASEIGEASLRSFADLVMQNVIRRQDRLGVDWFALGYCSPQVRQDVTDWINVLAGSERVLELASDPNAPEDWGGLQSFSASAGRFETVLMPGPH